MAKVVFRADASPAIGYGHYIRSLALADMLRGAFDCTMVTSSPTDGQRSQADGICPLVALPADESRFELFLRTLKGDETVVLDNYFYTTDYQREIKSRGCRLVCIDDMHNIHYVADAVINHGFVDADAFSREPHTRLCLGPQWALLRRPFLQERRVRLPRRSGAMKAAVCFGGSDPLGLGERFESALREMDSVGEVVRVGGMGSRYSAQDMAELIRGCDIAVVSMSTVCLEALACGAAVAAGWYADNQKEGYEALTARGWIAGLGDLTRTFPSPAELRRIVETAAPAKDTPFGEGIRERYLELFKNLTYGN